MADRSPPLQKFPKFEEVDPRSMQFKHDSFRSNKTHKYVVSASKELVALLNALTCRQCEQKREMYTTFSADSPPYIALCGHYVHKDCRYVNRHTTNGTWFSCNRCSNLDLSDLRPSKRPVFEDFYKKVEEKGFRCFACEEDENMHPRYNVVQITYLSHSDGTLAFLCVWCYAAKNYFQTCCGKVLDINTEDSNVEEPLSGIVSKKLNSVDSTLHCKQFINFQCCCCMKPLIPWLREPKDLKDEFDKPVKGKEDLEHLGCGHIRHEDCKLHFKGTTVPDGKRVYCHLCPSDCSVDDAKKQVIVSQLKGYVKEDIGYSAFKCHKCGYFHPINNEARQTDKTSAHRMCVWCKSEEVMVSREKRYVEKTTRSTASSQIASSRACSIS